MTWEKVHTVHEFYDRPQVGVADFLGTPHLYQSIFSEELDEFTDRFWVMPIDHELFLLLMEDWAIWLRWAAALRAGAAQMDTHPALPEDRQRRDELKEIIGGRLIADPGKSVIKVARFQGKVWNDMQVEWTEPPDVAPLS
jgi:hypothetical protein